MCDVTCVGVGTTLGSDPQSRSPAAAWKPLGSWRAALTASLFTPCSRGEALVTFTQHWSSFLSWILLLSPTLAHKQVTPGEGNRTPEKARGLDFSLLIWACSNLHWELTLACWIQEAPTARVLDKIKLIIVILCDHIQTQYSQLGTHHRFACPLPSVLSY